MKSLRKFAFQVTALLSLLMLAACGTALTSARRDSGVLLPPAGANLLLLGEVHDNAAQHALRLQALQAVLDHGARPALLMEQFDGDRQADIDQALRRLPDDGDADPATIDAVLDRLVATGGGQAAGWNWSFYRPYLRLALQYRLPVVAANVSRQQARLVMQQGLAARGFDAAVPADIASAHADSIAASHCGQIDATQAQRVAMAQAARDQFMARQVQAQAARGVVLLAGNGHVRKDVGLVRWLTPALVERSWAVGYLESGDDAAPSFDQAIFTSVQPRRDPCAPKPAAG